MDRFFCLLLLCAVLLPARADIVPREQWAAQPVLFSLIFPQLIPKCLMDHAQREAREL